MGSDKRSGEHEGPASAVSATGAATSPAPHGPDLSLSLPDTAPQPPKIPGIATLAASAAIARAMGHMRTSAAQVAPEPPPQAVPIVRTAPQLEATPQTPPVAKSEPQHRIGAPSQTAVPSHNIAAQAARAAETLALEYAALHKGSGPSNLKNKPAVSMSASQQADIGAATNASSEPSFEPVPKTLAPLPSALQQVQVSTPTLAALTAQAAVVRAKAFDAARAHNATMVVSTGSVDNTGSADRGPAADGGVTSDNAVVAGPPAGDTVVIAPTPAPAHARTQVPRVSLAMLPAVLRDAIDEGTLDAQSGVSAPFVPAVTIVAFEPVKQPARHAAKIDSVATFLTLLEPQPKLPPPQAPPQLSPPPIPDVALPPVHSEIETTGTAAAEPTPTAVFETARAEAIPASALPTPSAAALRQQLTGAVPVGQDIILRPVPERSDRYRRQDTSTRPRSALWRQSFVWARKLFKIAAFGAVGYGVLCIALIFVYRFVDPPTSNLMLWQRLTGTTPLREWVALDKISPNLIKAVIASEDARFCRHGGVDFKALRFALRQTGKRHGRGASTISMQVTKNLFLWNSRSYVRKAIEIPMTLLMELIWPKWRVLEVYLNIAEWGEGVFGAQAASAYHFSKPARRLSPRQAALLVVLLPNPISREAGDPSRATRRRAARIEKRVKGSANVANCVLY